MERLDEVMKRAAYRRSIGGWKSGSRLLARPDHKPLQNSIRVTPSIPTQEDKYKREASRLKDQLTRARRANLPDTLTLEQWISTLDHFQWKCAYCEERDYQLLEHFIPLSHGKGTTQDNCVPACTKCNVTKSAWHPLSEYRPDMEGLEAGLRSVKCYLEQFS